MFYFIVNHKLPASQPASQPHPAIQPHSQPATETRIRGFVCDTKRPNFLFYSDQPIAPSSLALSCSFLPFLTCFAVVIERQALVVLCVTRNIPTYCNNPNRIQSSGHCYVAFYLQLGQQPLWGLSCPSQKWTDRTATKSTPAPRPEHI